MFIDLTLFMVFLASTFVLWYRVSLKIPQVVAIPDQVITERLHEDSAKLRLFILHIKTYYREGQYKPYLWNFLLKTLYRLHLVLLKTDNVLGSYLKSIRAKAEKEGILVVKLNGLPVPPGNGSAKDSEYWQKLQDQTATTPAISKHTRIEEVKKR
jgi:hypothetical protein